MAPTGVSIKGGKVLIKDGNVAIAAGNCNGCCGDIYVMLLFTGGGLNLTLRARSLFDGAFLWDFTAPNFSSPFGLSRCGLAITSFGILVFAPGGANHLFKIALDGTLINSALLTLSTGNVFNRANLGANGNRGFIFGLETVTNNKKLAEFNMTTLAQVADATVPISAYVNTGVNDRVFAVGAGVGLNQFVFMPDTRTLTRHFGSTLSFDIEFLPLPLGGSVPVGIALINDLARSYCHLRNTNRGYFFSSAGSGSVQGTRLLRYPVWDSDSVSATVPNSAWQNFQDRRTDRYSNPATLIDSWAWSNIPGFDNANDNVYFLNRDISGNYFMWWNDVSATDWYFVRLNADFTTIDFVVLDTDMGIFANFSFIQNGVEIITLRGNGRSKSSAEGF